LRCIIGTKEGGDSPRAYLASRDRLGRPVCFQLAAAAVLTREFADLKILSPRQSAILTKDPHPRTQLKRNIGSAFSPLLH